MNEVRRQKIKQHIQKNEVVTIKELQALCPDVSLMTIHRDLDALETAGLIYKIRGGARSIRQSEESVIAIRQQENTKAKTTMAEKALSLITPGTSLFLDAGTSNLYIASVLPDISLTIFTTAPNIALELSHLVNPSINMCGGSLNRNNLALSGQNTLDMLGNINIDLAFVGVSGCSALNGFTCGNESEMLVKKLVIKKAWTSVILCDSSKMKKIMPFTFATLSEVDYIISDDALSEEFIKAANQADCVIL